MQPPQHRSRINLADMKALIVKKLGQEGSKQYFYYLNMFLNLKLTKVEFNKHCVRIVGRENIPLHNQLICSVLRNACSANSLPTASYDDHSLKRGLDANQQNGSHKNMTSTSSGLSLRGDMLPVSPRKVRTGFRGRRAGDHHRTSEPNGKSSLTPQLHAITQSSDFNVALENGDLLPHDIVQLSEDRNSVAKISVARILPDGLVPSCSKDQNELVIRDDLKVASDGSRVQAPLGVPFCSASIGGAQRAMHPASSSTRTGTFTDGVLLDSIMLREWMDQIAATQGLQGVSKDSANILNHGLDSYIKGLIRSCIELAGIRSGQHQLMKNNNIKHHSKLNVINAVGQGYQYQVQNDGRSLDVQEQGIQYPISLQDFKVAMELNPQKLGEDWPLLLEKICTHAFEE